MVLPPEALGDALREAGAPARFGELDPPIRPEIVRWALRHCHLMRNRFTLADLLFYVGWWDEALVERLLDRARSAGGGLWKAPGRIYRGYVFDLDGTVYLGDELLRGARETLEELKRLSRVVYLTNKPLQRPADYAAKLTRLGVETSLEEVISSVDALLLYLDRHAPDTRLFVIGEQSLIRTLRAAGGVPARDTLLVGDRLATDMRFAREAGMAGALILTGATTLEEALGSGDRPDYVIDHLGDLLPRREARS
jgi:histidinol phosphatase-like enzyme